MNQTTHISLKPYTIIKRAYFEEEALPSLKKTAELISPTERTLVIAGKTITFKCYGKSLDEVIERALSHHTKGNQNEAELTINLWDNESSNTELCAPWGNEAYFERKTDNAQISDDGFLGVFLFGEETLNFYDPQSNTAYFWTHDANVLPDWIRAAPLRTLFHWFLGRHNIHLIHGAVIGTNEGAVLLTAKGGSGKSTTALSCLMDDMHYLADDYVAIEDLPTPVAHSLYNSVKIRPDMFNAFPELKDHIDKARGIGADLDEFKKILFLNDLFPGKIHSSLPLKAIFIPRVQKEETHITPSTLLAAFMALIPTTLFQLPLAPSSKLNDLKRLMQKVPTFTLNLGPNVRAVPATIRNFLADKKHI